jgi:predicted AlkP superfamily phosphohydrolase/phosphomutase
MTLKIRSLSLALLAVLSLATGALSAQQSSGKKLIILGFDGVDAKLTERWMNEGKLPNLAKLRSQGAFSPLRPTIPSQTPVSWSTFATGLNPGRHGVFDFLKRNPKDYRPAFCSC